MFLHARNKPQYYQSSRCRMRYGSISVAWRIGILLTRFTIFADRICLGQRSISWVNPIFWYRCRGSAGHACPRCLFWCAPRLSPRCLLCWPWSTCRLVISGCILSRMSTYPTHINRSLIYPLELPPFVCSKPWIRAGWIDNLITVGSSFLPGPTQVMSPSVDDHWRYWNIWTAGRRTCPYSILTDG